MLSRSWRRVVVDSIGVRERDSSILRRSENQESKNQRTEKTSLPPKDDQEHEDREINR